MDAWECTECGYVWEGERPPHRCPECGVSGDRFEFIEDQIDDWSDEEDWHDEDEEDEDR